jgi:hypothetical protein
MIGDSLTYRYIELVGTMPWHFYLKYKLLSYMTYYIRITLCLDVYITYKYYYFTILYVKYCDQVQIPV